MVEWMKALHIIFMVTWFAGLFYLPRLFVYHAMPENAASFKLFKVMERRLYIMMSLGATLTFVFGTILFSLNAEIYLSTIWFPIKLALLSSLLVYHFICWKIIITFRKDNNQRSHAWYRWFNEVPSILLMGIVILAVLKF